MIRSNIRESQTYLVDQSADGGHTWSVQVPHTAFYQPSNFVFETPVQQVEASTKFHNKITNIRLGEF